MLPLYLKFSIWNLFALRTSLLAAFSPSNDENAAIDNAS